MSKSIKDVMTANPKTVRENDPVTKAAQLMKDSDSGLIPVCDDSRRVLGVITDRDIVTRVIAAEKDVTGTKVSDVMTRTVHTLTQDAPLEDVHEVMRTKQVRRVPIVNDQNELVGIVAQADLATRNESDRKTGQTVEEISRPEAR